MRALSPLEDDPAKWFEWILSSKNEPHLSQVQAVKVKVLERYDLYSNSILELNSLFEECWTSDQSNSLRVCYSSRSSSRNALVAAILLHQVESDRVSSSYCQYCGLTYNPRTLDHYLPKGKFPEFSVMCKNLIPCCYDCNELKGECWLKDGCRGIVNLYFDKIPSSRYLFARTGPAPDLEFFLSDDSESYGDLEGTIRHHFDQLDLLNRYRLASGSIISEIANLVMEFGVDGTRERLIEEQWRFTKGHSPNYWRVALCEGLANDPAFLEALPNL